MEHAAAPFVGLRIGSRLRRLYMALCVLFATPNWVSFGIGAAVVALAEVGVLLSYAALLRNRRLTTHGPYAVCRNPVYFCACAHGFGLFILSGGGSVCGTLFPRELWLVTPFGVLNPVVLVASLLFLPLYVLHQHRRAVTEERKLCSVWAEYRNYAASVPRFIPSLRGLLTLSFLKGGHFSWRVCVMNRAPSRAAKYFLVVPATLLLWRLKAGFSGVFFFDAWFWVGLGGVIVVGFLYLFLRRYSAAFEQFRNCDQPVASAASQNGSKE